MSNNARGMLKPGSGWKHIGGAVYEHANGTRVHLNGYVRMPNGDFLSENKWPEGRGAFLMIRANGGNRKRGLMAWARSMFTKPTPDPQAKIDCHANA